jgi:hypothetical protein
MESDMKISLTAFPDLFARWATAGQFSSVEELELEMTDTLEPPSTPLRAVSASRDDGDVRATTPETRVRTRYG